MRAFLSILGGLVRPAKGLDGAGASVKWLWIPLAVMLLASVGVKVLIATPMQLEAQMAQGQAMFEKEVASWPEEQRVQYEKDMAAAEAAGDLTEEDAMAAAGGITQIAGFVFGILGAAVAIGYIATYFFVAAKTWANPVKYTTMLTVASLAMLPQAIRNFVQAAYMGSTGVWLEHAGLGALVAPADIAQPPGLAYAVLSQIDVFVIWTLFILVGALVSNTVGIEKKRAFPAIAVFIGITMVLQAVPTLIQSLFMGLGGPVG